MARRVLRPRKIQEKLGIGKTTYYDLNKNDPTFPKDVLLGKRARGKFEDEVDSWLESKQVVVPK